MQRSLRLTNGQLVVNPGSVGLPAFDDDAPVHHKIESGTPHARYAILLRDETGEWDVEPRRVSYDWDTAGDMAEQQGRPDWARAIRTGRC